MKAKLVQLYSGKSRVLYTLKGKRKQRTFGTSDFSKNFAKEFLIFTLELQKVFGE